MLSFFGLKMSIGFTTTFLSPYLLLFFVHYVSKCGIKFVIKQYTNITMILFMLSVILSFFSLMKFCHFVKGKLFCDYTCRSILAFLVFKLTFLLIFLFSFSCFSSITNISNSCYFNCQTQTEQYLLDGSSEG